MLDKNKDEDKNLIYFNDAINSLFQKIYESLKSLSVADVDNTYANSKSNKWTEIALLQILLK